MATEQLIYTSCKTGINNQGSGFQVYSYSNNLETNLLTDIQRFSCVYKQPNTLPSMPTKNELNELFPIAFSYNQLNSINMCLSQSVYIGKDYALENGRSGNYISHVLVEQSRFIDYYPIELYNSSLFLKYLSDEKTNRVSIPEVLPGLTKVDIEHALSSTISFDTVKDFLCENEDRMSFLKQMITAVTKANKLGRKILICDTPHNIATWIGAITMSFPICCAKNIPFITYTYDPDYTNALICGVFPEGTTYNSQSAIASGMYFIFDFTNEVFTPIETDSKFVDLVEVGFEFSKDSLELFHQFLEKIQYCHIDENIHATYCLYKMYNGNYGDLTQEELYLALEFAGNNGDDDILLIICDAIERNTDKFVLNATFKTAEALYKFIRTSAIRLEENRFQELSFAIFYSCLLQFVNNYKIVGMDEIENFYNLITNYEFSEKAAIKEYLFTSSISNEVSIALEGNVDTYINMFYMKLLACFLVEHKITINTFAQTYNIEIFKRILANIRIVEDEKKVSYILSILNLFNGEWSLSMELYATFFEKISLSDFQKKSLALKYIDFLIAADEMQNIRAVFNYLFRISENNIVYELFGEIINQVQDPKKIFWELYDDSSPEFTDLFGDKVVSLYLEKYLENFNEKRIRIEIGEIIISRLSDIKSSELVKWILYQYETRIDIKNINNLDKFNKQVIKKVFEYKKQYSIISFPDKSTIIYHYLVINELCKKGIATNELIEYCAEINAFYFENISNGEQRDLLERLLPVVIPLINKEKEHMLILGMLSNCDSKLLFEIYTDEVIELYENEGDERRFLSYFALITTKKIRITKKILDNINEDFLNMVYHMTDKKINKLSKIVEKGYNAKVVENWENLLVRAKEKKEKSILGKVRRLFNR